MNSDDYRYWYNYRRKLTSKISKLETPDNVYKDEDEKRKAILKMALDIGIKPTARHFNTSPAVVRYWVKKYKKD